VTTITLKERFPRVYRLAWKEHAIYRACRFPINACHRALYSWPKGAQSLVTLLWCCGTFTRVTSSVVNYVSYLHVGEAYSVLATQVHIYIITRLHPFLADGLVAADIVPELNLVCNTAMTGDCDFREGFTTRPEDSLDGYRSPCTRKMRDQFQVLYAATVGYANQLRAGRLAAKPRTSFTHYVLSHPICRRHSACKPVLLDVVHLLMRVLCKGNADFWKIDSVPIGRSPFLHLTLRQLACCLEPGNALYGYRRLSSMKLDAVVNQDVGAVAKHCLFHRSAEDSDTQRPLGGKFKRYHETNRMFKSLVRYVCDPLPTVS